MNGPRQSANDPLGAGYAGDVSPKEVWGVISSDAGAHLIDVRTEAEWNFVGVPDLASQKRQAILCEWQRYPPGANPGFVQQVEAALKDANYTKGSPLFFLCRSGGRSRAAAIAMTAAGYGPCFNVADGFEGALDAKRHRGTAGGWKAEGLPWVQF